MTFRVGGYLRHVVLLASLVFGLAVLGSAFTASARADTIGPITFEPTRLRSRRHQRPERLDEDRPVRRRRRQRLDLPGCCRVRVRRTVAPTVQRGHQRYLRRPDVLAGLSEPGRGVAAEAHFDASFQIGTTNAGGAVRPETCRSAPTTATAARMSYLRFEDRADGVHVFFGDVTNPGPLATVSTSTRRTSPSSTGRRPHDQVLDRLLRPARPTMSSRSTSTACSRPPARPGRTTTASTRSRPGTATSSRPSQQAPLPRERSCLPR